MEGWGVGQQFVNGRTLVGLGRRPFHSVIGLLDTIGICIDRQ